MSFRTFTRATNAMSDASRSIPPRKQRERPELRVARRDVVARRTTIQLAHPADAGAVTVTVCDTSPRGVGLVTERPLAPGEQFVLRVVDRDRTVPLLYTVVRCKKCGDRHYRVGATFDSVAPQPSQASQAATSSAAPPACPVRERHVDLIRRAILG